MSLAAEEVINIKERNRNPDVAIGPEHTFSELKKIKKYAEAVRFFERRIKDRYFVIGKQLSKRKKHKSGDIFLVMMLDCIILDFLSQYRYGLEASKREKFKEFFNAYLNKYNKNINPCIESCSFNITKGWTKVIINDISDAIYHGFRCSLIHSGIISEYGRINQLHDDPIVIKPWECDNNKIDIIVNPPKLLEELHKVFKAYIKELRYSNDSNIKNGFIKRFEFDYGVKLTIK